MSAARWVGRARRAARRLSLGGGRRAVLWLWYRWRLTRPLDPKLAVFAAYWHRGVFGNPRAIYELARKAVPDLRPVWVVQEERIGELPPGTAHVVPGSARYLDVLARAAVLVNNVNFWDGVVKRRGSVHVMTHHGTPLKCMGLDLIGKDVPDADMDFDALVRRCARWDLSLSSNRYSTEIWSRALPGDYESLEVGYPRTDVLVNATEEHRAAVRAALGIRPEQRAILYAPTHRDNDAAYVERLDLKRLSDRLGDDWVVLARLHYFYDRDEALRTVGGGNVIDATRYPAVQELCLASDLLVTDYSSIMFDYALLDRPIVVYAPDWEDFVASRGVYFDLLASPPGAVARTEAALYDVLADGSYQATAASDRRQQFRQRFCEFGDGTATQAVVLRLWPDAVVETAASV